MADGATVDVTDTADHRGADLMSARPDPSTVRTPPIRRILLDGSQRPRLPLRLLGYLVVWTAAYAGAGVLLAGPDPSLARNLLAHLAAVVVAVVVTWAFRRWADRRAWAELGLPRPTPRHARHVLLGALVGVAPIGLSLMLGIALGGYQVVGTEFGARGLGEVAVTVAAGSVFYLTSAVIEELGWRGYVFSNLAERVPVWTAALVTGILFAAPHLVLGSSSPAFAVLAMIDYTLLSTLFLLARRHTGSLWAAIGIHMGWNVGGDYLFGIGVTAEPDFGHSVLHVQQTEWTLLFGGRYNADSSLLGILTELVMIVGYCAVTRRQAARR